MITNKFPYSELKRTTINKKRVYATESGPLPSVTTILAKTKPWESVKALNEWRDRVGSKEAQRITTEAANVGTLMHNNLENWLIHDAFETKGNMIHLVAKRMANTVIENIKDDLTEVWGTEVGLYYPGLYAGTTDLAGMWKNNQAIMDFKQTNKPKKREWIDDYFLQLAAYGEAHNALYGTTIREGHVLMCSRDCEFQHFEIVGDEYDHYADMWAQRIEQYYKLDK